ncbi:MAG: hypothetical protein WDZ44_00430 [Candidatus Spechtbacterales bacterium]
MVKSTEKEGMSTENKKALISLAFVAGTFAFRYKDVLIHKAVWALVKKSAPYLLLSLVVLVALVAGLTFVFVKVFS